MASVQYRRYDRNQGDFERIRRLVETHLSEPYSLFTYHFFLHHQPHLCRVVLLPCGRETVFLKQAPMSRPTWGSRRTWLGSLLER